MMKLKWSKPAAALCLALALAACAAAPADKDIAAPEFPWANGYDETVAALQERGADFTADPGADGYQPSVRMDSGTLFGVLNQSITSLAPTPNRVPLSIRTLGW